MTTLRIIAASYLAGDRYGEVVELARALRRADDFIRLSVTCAHGLKQELGDSWPTDHSHCGLVLGSGFGTMQTNFEVLDQIINGEQVSPTLFSHSVFNAATGYAASILGLHGPAMTVTDFAYPFGKALQQAMWLLESGSLELCLVMQTETYSQVLQTALTKGQWPSGSICWVLAGPRWQGEGGVPLLGLQVEDQSFTPGAMLDYSETLRISEGEEQVGHPLAAMARLTELIRSGQARGCCCAVESVWGRIMLKFGT